MWPIMLPVSRSAPPKSPNLYHKMPLWTPGYLSKNWALVLAISQRRRQHRRSIVLVLNFMQKRQHLFKICKRVSLK